MLYWTVVFFIIAIVAGLLGFGGIASGAASIAEGPVRDLRRRLRGLAADAPAPRGIGEHHASHQRIHPRLARGARRGLCHERFRVLLQSHGTTPDYPRRYEEGRVTAIDVVRGAGPSSSVAGAVVGGIIGGVLGHQVGNGRGNDVATVVGAVGGAVIDSEIGKGRSGNGPDTYRVTVRQSTAGTRDPATRLRSTTCTQATA